MLTRIFKLISRGGNLQQYIELTIRPTPWILHFRLVMSTSPPYPNEKKAEDGSYGYNDGFPSDSEEGTTFNALIAEDHGHEIRLRTMSWQKAAWLLAGDQVCLAIMAQTWSLSVLGWVPGIITMILSGAFFWITSITMHKYIMKHPQIKDICEFL